jgi:hypothetical protein
MATQPQIDANRKNAAKSTGPRSEAGKLTCSQNAFKSGVYSEAPLVTGENPADLDNLALAYRRSFHPTNPGEDALVETLVQTEWLTRRMRRVETQLWNRATDALRADSWYEGDPAYELAATYGRIEERLERLQRRLSSLERIYHRTLHDLRRLQADRPKLVTPQPESGEPADPPAEIGFVPSTAEPPAEPAPAATPQPPSPAPQIGFVPSISSLPAEPVAAQPTPASHRAIIRYDAGRRRQPDGAL